MPDPATPEDLAFSPGRRRLQQANGLDEVAFSNGVRTNQYIQRPEFDGAGSAFASIYIVKQVNAMRLGQAARPEPNQPAPPRPPPPNMHGTSPRPGVALSHPRMSLEAGAKRPAARTPFSFDFALSRYRPARGRTGFGVSVLLFLIPSPRSSDLPFGQREACLCMLSAAALSLWTRDSRSRS